MAHYARLDKNNVVTEILVIDWETLQLGLWGDPSEFKQTSYNTRGGIYYTPNTIEPDPDQSKAFRKNYAQIGYTYDEARDAFINPKPEPDEGYEFDEFACLWKPIVVNLTMPE